MTANEIARWAESAVGDMAYDHVDMWERTGYGDNEDKFKAMKEDGVRDIAGCYADDMWDDPQLLCDLMADRVCEEAGWGEGSDVKFNAIVEEIRDYRKQSKAWNKACDLMLRT